MGNGCWVGSQWAFAQWVPRDSGRLSATEWLPPCCCPAASTLLQSLPNFRYSYISCAVAKSMYPPCYYFLNIFLFISMFFLKWMTLKKTSLNENVSLNHRWKEILKINTENTELCCCQLNPICLQGSEPKDCLFIVKDSLAVNQDFLLNLISHKSWEIMETGITEFVVIILCPVTDPQVIQSLGKSRFKSLWHSVSYRRWPHLQRKWSWSHLLFVNMCRLLMSTAF